MENSKDLEAESKFTSRFCEDFEIISCLGRGAHGVVFQAKNKVDQVNYAVKRVNLSDSESESKLREVKEQARLKHDNIVRYVTAWKETPPARWQEEEDAKNPHIKYLKDHGTGPTSYNSSVAEDLTSQSEQTRDESSDGVSFAEPTSYNSSETEDSIGESEQSCDESSGGVSFAVCSYLYIQLELCEKESLKHWMRNNMERSKTKTLEIFHQICTGLAYVHKEGLVHRDVKPANIYFSSEGVMKIGDFGLVTKIHHVDYIRGSDGKVNGTHKQLTNQVGTQMYMSPEQLDNNPYDKKVDIYALGLVFFELLVPFSTESERIDVMANLKKGKYPEKFEHVDFQHEKKLLIWMLNSRSENRPEAKQILEDQLMKDLMLPDGIQKEGRRVAGLAIMDSSLSIDSFFQHTRAHSISDVLNYYLPSLLKSYIKLHLEAYLANIPRTTDGYLSDSSGNMLRFDPDNQPAPPNGPGLQLCFKALPHHTTKANIPIVIHNVDEFSLLFCREFIKNKNQTIMTMDSSSLLNILARASCFPMSVMAKARLVRDEVRNQWAHGDYSLWTRDNYI